jgi:PAS domain-containing protein
MTPFFVRDMSDVITYWKRGAQELYGWTAEKAIGKRLRSFCGQSRIDLDMLLERQSDLLTRIVNEPFHRQAIFTGSIALESRI